ncbi:putative phage tail component, N-terminal domain-containing protein [Desulfotomaculum arcticum]|uniref:Putative phage tail component, N-terminal domain-containing protein n=1 Tax=Desulfotruncus arcticus DSM 17038 TaxID=1121424 RepID=A0A1I2YD52_9FIRM|nr:distal tail protein Dit [Desulfotruncus arcticus]SFH22916.1 putative phage tail component, N-terminal domain-containing protein [Desulfotomaculum arcticum] [Desulfotruncus arcticus DSM 17038]
MSFSFNGIDSKTYVTVNVVRQSILPPVASKTVSIPKRAGALDFGTELGVRQIEVAVTIKAASWEELRVKARQLADWLYQDDLKPLVFSDEPDKIYMARVTGETDIDEIVYNGQGNLLFLCPEPFAAGQLINQTVAVAKPNPVFARASAAFLEDGTSYSVNQPRYKAGQYGEAVFIEEGTTNHMQTAEAPAEETLTALTPGAIYTLSTEGTDQAVTLEHVFMDDLATGTQSGVHTDDTDLKLTLEPAFSNADTIQGDFNGTHSNTQATAGGLVELTKIPSGTDYAKTETTQADFLGGTLTDVTANANGELKLATEQVTSTQHIIKKATFEDDESTTVGNFFQWYYFDNSSNQHWSGDYSYTTNYYGYTIFVIPAGAENAKMNFPTYPSSGITEIYVNGTLIRKLSAANYWTFTSYNLTPGRSYNVSWEDGGHGYRCYVDDFTVQWDETTTTDQYKSTGSRVSPAYNISTVGTVATSRIAWTEITPSASTTVKVEVTLDGGTTWAQCTNGGEIPGLAPDTDVAGKSLKWRVTLATSDPTQTPKVSDITVEIAAKDVYRLTGTYTSPIMTLSPSIVMTSTITWGSVVPTGAGLTVQTNYAPDGTTWAGWQTVAKGGAVPGLPSGSVIASGAKLQYRATLTPTADQKQTPQLTDLAINISKANTGTRSSAAYDISNVEAYFSSVISWTATVPAGASLTVETSVDAGTSWQAATNGGAISGLIPGQSLSGITVMTRATLKTVTSPEPPTLHSLIFKVSNHKTGNLITVTPATAELKLTPSGVTKWQLEEKPYQTTWTVGTREPETLTLDMGGGLESDQGTFEVRAFEDGRTDRNAFLWDSHGAEGSRFLFKKLTDGTYELHFNNTLVIKTSGIAMVGSHVFAARWNGSQVWLLIDGVEWGTATLATPANIDEKGTIFLGSSFDTSEQWNNTIDEVRASKIVRTTAELAANDTGGPLPLDENTSCLMAFDGNLGVGAVESPCLTYNGTARTYPLFTMKVKAPIPYVKLQKGSKHVLVTYDFQHGDILVIDNDRATIEVNGLRAMNCLDVSSDFFMLDRGLNEFTLEPAAKCDVTIQYQEKWL